MRGWPTTVNNGDENREMKVYMYVSVPFPIVPVEGARTIIPLDGYSFIKMAILLIDETFE